MAVTYRSRKRTVPYRTRLTGRLISCNEGFDADRIEPLTILTRLSFRGVRSTSPESIHPPTLPPDGFRALASRAPE